MDNFHQSRKYHAQIYSHQSELRREGIFTDKKYLSISSSQTDYLNIDRISGFGKNKEREKLVQKRCTFCGDANCSSEKYFKRIIEEKGNARAVGDLENRRTERNPRKRFRCGYENHLIAKCPKPLKENEKRQRQVRFSERGNHASQEECNNGDNNNYQKIYAYMARMSDNDKSLSRDFGDSLQLTNWILDSGATCHMTPHVLGLFPVY